MTDLLRKTECSHPICGICFENLKPPLSKEELTKLAHDVARASLQGFFGTGEDGFAQMNQNLRKQAVKRAYQILKARLSIAT